MRTIRLHVSYRRGNAKDTGRRWGGGAAALLSRLLIGVAPAQVDGSGPGDGSGATAYTFTTVLDSQRDGLEATRCAAINTLGTVAVQVRDNALGINMLVTKRGADDAPRVIADTERVADFPTFCDNGITSIPSDPSINEKGEVAFQGNLRRLSLQTRPDCAAPEQRETPRQGVFVGKGAPLTTIAHTINQPGGDFIAEFLVADQSVNTFGKVAIVPELDDNSSRGSSSARRMERSISGFSRTRPPPTGSTSTTSGRACRSGSRFDDNFNQIFSINTSRGGAVTTVAESSSGGYASFSEPSLNDLGRVAFTAEVQPDPDVFITIQGVFAGPDPVADKVLQVGDLYEGVPVTSVRTCAEARNNRGQIVMTVQSENPDTFEVRTFVVKATPSGSSE